MSENANGWASYALRKPTYVGKRERPAPYAPRKPTYVGKRAPAARRMRDHADMRVHPRLSASCLALALMLGSMWWSAMSTYAVLHDDARLVSALAKTLDQPDARRQLAAWTETLLDQAVELAGSPDQTRPAQQAAVKLQRAIASTAPIEPLVGALTTVVVTTRDAAVSQLDAKASPKSTVSADVAPLLTLAGIKLDKKTAKSMGVTLDKKHVSVPLLTGEDLDKLQHRYDLMVLVRRWAGWLGLGLLAVSVATSRYPLRTLAVAAGLIAVIALVLPHLLDFLRDRLLGSELGALVTPLLAAASGRVATVAGPVALIGGLLALGLGAVQVLLLHRHRASPPADTPS